MLVSIGLPGLDYADKVKALKIQGQLQELKLRLQTAKEIEQKTFEAAEKYSLKAGVSPTKIRTKYNQFKRANAAVNTLEAAIAQLSGGVSTTGHGKQRKRGRYWITTQSSKKKKRN